jgi:delta 1-pyrroline-5-carboxylate dehydrogenase
MTHYQTTYTDLILDTAPAIVGNVVVWKPSPMATYANYITYQILAEAGVPAGVLQFVPGPAADVVQQALAHREFAALHFTGSTHVFKQLWKDIAANVDTYRSYPRIVGETGGKNFHLVHPSADVKNAVNQSIRAAFEYQGKSIVLHCLHFTSELGPQVKSARRCPVCTYQHPSGMASSRTCSSPRSKRSQSAASSTSSTSWDP